MIVSTLIVATAIVLWFCSSARLVQSDRQLLTLAIAWLVIPTAVILTWSAMAHPIYTPRYLCFTAPAMALVLSVCIGAFAARHGPRRPPWAFSLSLRAQITSGAAQFVRKYGMDYSQVADLITAKAAPGGLSARERHGDLHARPHATVDGGAP